MTVSIDLKDLNNLKKGIAGAGVDKIIAEAKKAGLKVESQSGALKASGNDAQAKKIVENLKK